MRPGFIGGMSAANRSASYHMRQAQPRTRFLRPAPSALVQVVEELVQAPPTDEELRVLTDMSAAAETFVDTKVEAQLAGTRLLEQLRTLAAKTNISISDCIMILLTVYQTFLMLHPMQPPPPPPPQITVKVTVPTPAMDTNEIVRQVQERIEQEEGEAPEPSPEGHNKHN
jgi:hypothetical protein